MRVVVSPPSKKVENDVSQFCPMCPDFVPCVPILSHFCPNFVPFLSQFCPSFVRQQKKNFCVTKKLQNRPLTLSWEQRRKLAFFSNGMSRWICYGFLTNSKGIEEQVLHLALDGDGRGIDEAAVMSSSRLTMRCGMNTYVGPLTPVPRSPVSAFHWCGCYFHDSMGGPESGIPRGSFTMRVLNAPVLSPRGGPLAAFSFVGTRTSAAGQATVMLVALFAVSKKHEGEDATLLLKSHEGRFCPDTHKLEIRESDSYRTFLYDGFWVETSESHKYCGTFMHFNEESGAVVDQGSFYFCVSKVDLDEC